MLKIKLLFFILPFVFFSCKNEIKKDNSENKLILKDDLEISVTFDSIPTKIITLAPSLTEAIFSIQADSFLIGNTLYCNFPPEAKNIEKVGDMLSVDYEKILSLQPDLILMTVEGNSKDTYEKLKSLGLKIFVSNPRSFSGIKKTVSDMGKIFGKEEIAVDLISKWNSKFDELKLKVDSSEINSAMFVVSLSPIMLAGKNTFINELISSAGLKNIAEDSPMNYPVFSREQILKLNPDFLILEERFFEDAGNLESIYPEWKNLNAVKNNGIILINSDLYLVPGPRFINALEDLLNKIEMKKSNF